MKTFLAVFVAVACAAVAPAAVVATTTHSDDPHGLDGQIVVGDVIAGMLGTELPPLNGWHPANTDPLDQLPAFTDDIGVRPTGLTGLLNDFPGAGVPAKTVRYDFPATDLAEIRVLTGNNGGDGRIFSTTVIRYSNDGGTSYSLLGYFQSDPSGTINNAGSTPRYFATQVSVHNDASILLAGGVTNLIFELYAVDNTGGQMRDPYDGVNPYTGVDDGLTAAFVSPLVWELDVVMAPEPVCPGDCNCDGSVGFLDIDYFVAAIPNNEAGWRAMFAPGEPTCSFVNCDVNGNGDVGFDDIDPFVALIPSACP